MSTHTTASTVLILPGDEHPAALYADAIATHCAGVLPVRVPAGPPDQLRTLAAGASLAVVACTAKPATRFEPLARLRMSCGDIPVLALLPADQPAAANLALSIGADDVLLTAPGYLEQLPLRVRANLRRAAASAVDAARTATLAANLRAAERLNRELAARVDRLEDLAAADPLTSLANRRAFDQQLAQALSAAKRHDLPLTLLMLDIDGLKPCNDALGHAAGDQVLRALADVLRAESRGSDLPARLGGDEFAVLLPHTDPGRAMIVASRILAAFNARVADMQRRLAAASPAIRVVTRGRTRTAQTAAPLPNISIGLADRPKGSTIQPAALLEAADQALYRAKAKGKGRIEPPQSSVQVVTRTSPLAA